MTEISAEQRAEFLELIRDGHNRADAANQLGLTGSAFRRLCRRDEVFAKAYEEAFAQGREATTDRVRKEYVRRALDPESKSDRLLHYLAVTLLPEFEFYRRSRIEHTGADGGPIELSEVAGARDKLEAKVISLAERRAS